MFAFLKGAVAGAILSFVVAALIGHAGGTGGTLHVTHFKVQDSTIYWSWALFTGGTLLGWGIFSLLD